MGKKFGTDEWIKALQVELNNSAAYAKAAAKWEGDFCFVVNAGADNPQEIVMYMDLWHGECREAQILDNLSVKSPAFVMSASLPIWRSVFDKKLDPIKGMMTKKLALKGNKMKVMKAPKAAIELVNCAAAVDTEW